MSTYWRRVRYEGDKPPWTLREVPGKGLAAFASRKFLAGDWICTEFPATWTYGHFPFTNEQLAEIDKRVDELCVEDKEAFYDMANVFQNDTEYNAAAGIFMTNCFDMADSIYGESCAMYLALARLNHSCTPNVQQTHLPDTTEEVLYAARDIEDGEELNDCYIDLRQTRTARQTELQQHYRFQCHCAGCTGGHFKCMISNGSEAADNQQLSLLIDKYLVDDDRIRVRVAQYTDIVVSLITEEQHQTAIDVTVQIIRLLESPQYNLWGARYLSEAYITVHQLAAEIGQKTMAKEYLEKAYRIDLLLQGDRSTDTKKKAQMLLSYK